MGLSVDNQPENDVSLTNQYAKLTQKDFIITVIESMGEGVCVLEADGRITFINPTGVNILGWSKEELRGKNFYELLHLADKDGRYHIAQNHPLQQVISLGITLRDQEAAVLHSDGTLRFISYTATVAEYENGERQTVFLFRDITAQKKADEVLKQRERQLRFAQAITHIGSWEWDIVTQEITWTDELYRIYGYEIGAVDPSYELAMHHIHEEDRPRAEATIREAIREQKPFAYNCRLIRADGEERTITVHGTVRVNGAGKSIYVWGTVQDITDLQAAEMAHQRTLHFSQRLIDNNMHGIVAVNLQGVCMVWNPMMTDMTHIDTQDALQRPLRQLLDQIGAADQMQFVYQVLSEGENLETEFAYTALDREESGYIEARYAPILGDKHTMVGVLIMMQDVTERRAAMRSLRQSEERFRTLFNSAGTAILLLDEETTILQANPAWSDTSGYDQEQSLGRTLSTYVFPRHIFHDADWQNLLDDRQTRYSCEARLQRGDEQTIWVNLSFSRFRKTKGDPLTIIVLIENIDRRKTIEKELVELKHRLAKSRETERIRLAQELHDGPIQDLYATTYQLQALKRLVTTERKKELVENINNQFQQVNDTIRAICQDLRPPALAAFGLASAIRSYAERFQKLYPDITVSLDLVDDQQQLPEYVRLTLFRISQEMLSNIAKHAEATRVLIYFGINDEQLLLEIQDNGRGFEVPARWIDLARQGHLGLVGASERADEIGGQLLVLSQSGQGTVVRVTAPYPTEKTIHE